MKSFKNNWEKQDGDSFSSIFRFEYDSINPFIAHWNAGSNWRIKLYEKNFLVEINFGNDIDVLVFTNSEYYKSILTQLIKNLNLVFICKIKLL